jgi:hypothetical protein
MTKNAQRFIYPTVNTKTNTFEENGFRKWQPKGQTLADQIKARYGVA